MAQKAPERIVFVYTTYSAVVEAEKAGSALLEAQLAACVNILPGMISIYRWKGEIERGAEVVMIVKTRASLAEAVAEKVREMHSYDTPAILVIPIESVDSSYLAWLTAETERAAAPS
jgi:periplasmic divalent cation tolerance protein